MEEGSSYLLVMFVEAVTLMIAVVVSGAVHLAPQPIHRPPILCTLMAGSFIHKVSPIKLVALADVKAEVCIVTVLRISDDCAAEI